MLRLGPVEHGWGLTYLAPRDLFKMGVGKDWALFFFFWLMLLMDILQIRFPKQRVLEQLPEAVK